MIRWAARSVMPTASAISRSRISGSAATANRTSAWFVKNFHALAPLFALPVKDVPRFQKTRSDFSGRARKAATRKCHTRRGRDVEDFALWGIVCKAAGLDMRPLLVFSRAGACRWRAAENRFGGD